MKYVLTFTPREAGSVAEREHAARRSQQLLEAWQPSETATIHQWVNRVDGNGGFAVVEGDDPGELLQDLAVWTPILEFEVYPVLDLQDAVPRQQAALDVLEQLD